MRVAVTGKGGAGKSTVAGALARSLSRSGQTVVAVDADPNPNLGVSLGLSQAVVESMTPILNALLDSGHTHHDPMPPAESLLARYGIEAPEGVTVVATGRIERPSGACLCCGSHNVTRQFFAELPAVDRVVVADLEAGLNDLIWANPGPQDVVLVVSEGSAKSVEVARSAVHLAREMGVRRIVGVANRAVGAGAALELAGQIGVAEAVAVPDDPAIEEADRLGVSPADRSSGSPAMQAIADLGRLLVGVAPPLAVEGTGGER